ncbi:MAG: PH domain-containing protein, partial [Patescibacteria group bacterium]|nr:PH domain-containing protein [Patescibacteria group bacterium]
RKHWLLFAATVLPYPILAILPLLVPVFIAAIPQLAAFASTSGVDTSLFRLAYGVWLLVIWTTAWGAFTRYYLNVWVLTNLRIVEVTEPRFFDREVSSVLLNRVQDVTTEVAGALFSILGIGNLSVQSAGAVDEFHMNGLKDPDKIRDLILARAAGESKTAGGGAGL